MKPTKRIKSTFNYCGSKIKELKHLEEFIPRGQVILEPFLGSGLASLNFAKNFYVSENNSDIRNIWIQSATNHERFCEYVMDNAIDSHELKGGYYNLRESFNQKFSQSKCFDVERAAMIYLLQCYCHAGQYRVNSRGHFNSPLSKNILPKSQGGGGRCNNIEAKLENLGAASSKMLDITSDCFDAISRFSQNVDVIYCDPPYVNSEVKYSGGWTVENLFALASVLSNSGKHCVLQNYRLAQFDDTFPCFEIFSKISNVGMNKNEKKEMVTYVLNAPNNDPIF